MESKSDIFHCPHCAVSLTKSAAASILGSAGAGAWMGNLPRSVTCPRCGGAIDTRRMLAGDYDSGTRGSFIATLLTIIGLVAATMWLNNHTGFNLFISAVIAWGALCVLGLGWLAVIRVWQKSRQESRGQY